MRKAVLITVILIVCVLAPNLIWLEYSTARITNGGIESLSSVIVHAGNEKINLGELPPGGSRFLFLPKAGDSTYEVSYGDTANSEPACKDYVEGAMYHAETILASAKGSRCKVVLPIVSELFLLKIL